MVGGDWAQPCGGFPQQVRRKLERGKLKLAIACTNDVCFAPLCLLGREARRKICAGTPIFRVPLCPRGVQARRKNYVRIPNPGTPRIAPINNTHPPCFPVSTVVSGVKGRLGAWFHVVRDQRTALELRRPQLLAGGGMSGCYQGESAPECLLSTEHRRSGLRRTHDTARERQGDVCRRR